MNTAESRITPDADTAPLTERQLLLSERGQSILKSPLHELTHEHEDSALIERFLLEVESTDWLEDTKSEVYAALALALEVHEGQIRGPYPYSTHFIRVATRILSSDHFAIKDQPDLIIAALLHDTVEDRPTELMAALAGQPYEDFKISEELNSYKLKLDNLNPKDAATVQLRLKLQEGALESLDYYFDDTIEQSVSSVTNPPSDYNLTKLERNEIYRQHVEKTLQESPLAGIIKLSDFIDNAAGIKYNETAAGAKKLADKYIDLVPVFRSFVEQSQYFTSDVKRMLLVHLEKIADRCIEYNPALAL